MMKCAEFHPNCTGAQIVPANPDIAGVGVMVGFLTTTCLAFVMGFAILFLDNHERIVNICRLVFTHNKETYVPDLSVPYWRSPPFWSKVLSKNLLAFSDTQLATGLAIQFTARMKHCELSIYHFQIVTDLAFLTTITHLLALVSLRDYFVRNKWVNLPRIIIMLGNLAMLGYTSFVAFSYQLVGLDLASDLACFYKKETPPLKSAFAGRWAMLLIAACGAHGAVISAMYLFHNKERNQKYKILWLIGAPIRTWLIAPIYSIFGLQMVGKELRNTQALGIAPVQIEGSEKEWGFGQFLNVLLLALPLFAGWESFWEEKDEEPELRFGRSTRPSKTDLLQTANGPKDNKFSSRDNSMAERTIESIGGSPLGSYATGEFAIRDKLAAARGEERVGAADSAGCCEFACTSWGAEIDHKVSAGR